MVSMMLNVWNVMPPGHHTTHLDIKNPYGQHHVGCMDYDAQGASVHTTRQ